jgi:hypothetical protein
VGGITGVPVLVARSPEVIGDLALDRVNQALHCTAP